MQVLLATFGTDGDVFPYLALGAELRRQGHEVALAGSEGYRAKAIHHGFNFLELFSTRETETVLGNPDFWHPRKCGQLAAKWGIQFVERQFYLLESHLRKHGGILVANPGVLAARLLHDVSGVPLATMILQPWILPSIYRPAVLPGGMSPSKSAPRWIWRLYIRLVNKVGDKLLAHPLNELRQKLGHRKVQNVFDWWLSPQLVIGLFPPWFGPLQPDWPKQLELTDFGQYDGCEQGMSAEVETFLNSGEPPVAITFGTGIRHLTELYSASINACVKAGKRTLVISKHPLVLPESTFKNHLLCGFVPFTKLFPRCSAVIHHGGIGTTARALTSNVPQLIIPICFDQLDNALRVKEAHAGYCLCQKSASVPTIQRMLSEALSLKLQPKTERSTVDGIPQAARILERFHARF